MHQSLPQCLSFGINHFCCSGNEPIAFLRLLSNMHMRRESFNKRHHTTNSPTMLPWNRAWPSFPRDSQTFLFLSFLKHKIHTPPKQIFKIIVKYKQPNEIRTFPSPFRAPLTYWAPTGFWKWEYCSVRCQNLNRFVHGSEYWHPKFPSCLLESKLFSFVFSSRVAALNLVVTTWQTKFVVSCQRYPTDFLPCDLWIFAWSLDDPPWWNLPIY